MKKILYVIFFLSFPVYCWGSNQVYKSLVKIYSVKQNYDYQQPWQKTKTQSSTATGFFITKTRILTNAHAVTNSKYLQVRLEGAPEKYKVYVEYIADDYDLAILKLKEPELSKSIMPLEIGTLPKLRDKVVIYGYPLGGDKLSITEGVISRIEDRTYAYSQKKYLAIQTDAALNPGNSGGPAILNGKVIGVAFQSLRGGQNLGYIIPSHLIKHFLQDIEDDIYDGIPNLGFEWQNLESKSHRQMLGIKDSAGGILVKNVYSNSPMENIVFAGDILLAIENHEIGFDGTIKFRNNERTSFNYLLETKKYGDNIVLNIMRNKNYQKINLQLDVSKKPELIVNSIKSSVAPTYYIKAGMVFEPLTINYLRPYLISQLKNKNFPYNLIHKFQTAKVTKDKKEIVILVSVLADDANLGYHKVKNKIIEKVNGNSFKDFFEFTQLLTSDVEFIKLEDDNGDIYIINQELTKKRNELIKNRYGIKSLCSQNLSDQCLRF